MTFAVSMSAAQIRSARATADPARGYRSLTGLMLGFMSVTERRLHDGSLTELTDVDNPPAGEKQRYLLAVLYKIGRDSFELVSKLAEHLRIGRDRIGLAGLKDKAGVTMQEVSIDCISAGSIRADKVLSINKGLKRAALGNLRWSPRSLHHGEHAGNHFCILVRQVEAEPPVIDKAVRDLKRRGFINYFGHQRFGLGSSASGLSAVLVGRALVKGHYRAAVEEIMDPRHAATAEEGAAKRIWQLKGITHVYNACVTCTYMCNALV